MPTTDESVCSLSAHARGAGRLLTADASWVARCLDPAGGTLRRWRLSRPVVVDIGSRAPTMDNHARELFEQLRRPEGVASQTSDEARGDAPQLVVERVGRWPIGRGDGRLQCGHIRHLQMQPDSENDERAACLVRDGGWAAGPH